MRYILTCMLLLGLCSLSRAQITRAEYFLELDPGIGRATPISVTPGTEISTTLTVPLAAVSLGFHSLYLRTRDAQGRWSLTYKHVFYNTRLAPNNQALTAAEYFIDQDPGPGKGTAITLPANQTDARLSFAVNLRNTSAGPHTLYLRVADKTKSWSQAMPHAFFAKPGGVAAITAFRYNFTRQGFTSTTRTYQVPTPAPIVDLNFRADLSQLPVEGDYDMNIWAVSSDGQQSLVYTRRISFTVLSARHSPAKDDIFRNYPNPFRQETTIEFELPAPQHLTLIIRDIHGREVVTLTKDKIYSKGNQKILYADDALPAGIYICEIRGEKYTRAIKMVKQ